MQRAKPHWFLHGRGLVQVQLHLVAFETGELEMTNRQLVVIIVAHCCDICNREQLSREDYQKRLNELLAERGVDPVDLKTLETL